MTRTLTTETIKLWRNNAGITAGETAEDDPEHIAAKAILALTAEILANREAQPAWFYTTVSGRKGVVWHKGAPEDDTAIYTAPPAPAVPDALEKMRSIVADPRALPRRKEWISGQQYSYVLLENVEAMVDEACRAAMLAQPVSQRYTLPDGWIACSERMPEDGDVVLVCQEGGIIYCAEMEGGALYPDEFPRVPSEGREITHWMPLPAAPEGGNG
ncbi:DUF551 domain-containing protein [Serratia bockelmannii]|uniref:DUF551 domain-containing protein n=1 Tax=Serratia bockelmannii TaxID=2703793 RepID=UPI003FA762C4